MPIEIACACGKRFRVADEFAGRSGMCPGCGAAFSVPVPQASANRPVVAQELDEPEITKNRGGLRRLDPGKSSTAQGKTSRGGRASAGRTCAGCGAPMADRALICTACGRSTLTGRIVDSKAGDDDGKPPFLLFRPVAEVFGLRVTPVLILVALLLIVGPIVWYVTGPGQKLHVYNVKRAHVIPAITTGVAWDPSMAPSQADRIAGQVVGGLGGARGGNRPPTDSVGGDDALFVFRDDPQGGAIVLDVGLRQSVVREAGQTAGYDSVVNAADFELVPLEGQHDGQPLPAALLTKGFTQSQAALDLETAPTADYRHALPPPTPTRFNEQEDDAQVSAIAVYNGDTRGTVRLSAAQSIGGMPAPDGITATGQLEATHPEVSDFGVEYRYTGDELVIDWDDRDTARWSKDRIKKLSEMSPWYRYDVGLLFRPDDGSEVTGRYAVRYAGRDLATVDLTAVSPVPGSSATASGSAGQTPGGKPPPVSPIKIQQGVPSHRQINPNNPLSYFDILLEGRDRARGTVSASNLRQIGLLLMTYQMDRGELPESFAELGEHSPGIASLLANPRTEENPGFIYEKPPPGADPAQTPVVWESWQGNKDPDGAVLYGDGSIR